MEYDIINRFKILTEISNSLEEELSALITIKNINKGDNYICSGQYPKNLAYVKNGLFRDYYTNKDGKEVTTKNGRRMMKGKCPTCGTTMCRILGNKK